MITLATSTFGILLCKGGTALRHAHTNFGRIAYQDEGSGGIPVVFVHSFGGDSSHWEDAKDRLVNDHRVVRLELRGHGGSDSPKDGDYRIDSLAKDIASVVDKLDLKKFVLVGHSMGASAALEYAGNHPDRVVGLVLVDGNGDPKKIPKLVRNQIKKSLLGPDYEATAGGYWERILSGSRPETRLRILRDLQRNPKETVLSVTFELLDYDPIPALRRFKGPKLAVVTPANNDSFSLHSLQGGFAFRVMSGTGHWLHLDRPQEFYEIVKLFLDDL